MQEKIIYKDLSYQIIGLAMEVHNKLGSGFLEKVYENSMMVLFNRDKIKAEKQKPINVIFENVIVGEYIADIFVEDKVLTPRHLI
jgi:GxxExxY protein